MKLCKGCETAQREEWFEMLRKNVSEKETQNLYWHNIPSGEIDAADLRRLCVEANRLQNFGLGAETPLDIGD